ncbi:dehydrogenase/reductase SDR family member 12 [Basidiobolus meristosporus CBS 931.73]|uniref:Dehydrogenase/reductase SDR family member 12 n=1 Tax=Basidiobolus meristosporus CBS 931.73 TaxID=1314790 RepID=A0A1Y1Y472_9FUNG|nr:dehydrogenase/reductase SDR family member 12 [Basidiobolus meristosporus CBS 931.73]|eukprot:ORX92807.1 dehydrogenase/reductase SDR family member 12 [Basidiobolus meristosporus CBS 931.73]
MTIYRVLVWSAYGFWNYTKAGFERRAKSFNPEATEKSLFGKVAIVSGANSGLGKLTARELWKKGAIVHMLCRSPERGEEARKEILSSVELSAEQKHSAEERLKLHEVDISDPRSIQTFVRNWEAQGDPSCHILINNAGCMVNERKTTADGVELNFATNTLGTYYLTKLMIPLLQKSESPRVVTVSSGGMYSAKLDADDPECRKVKKFDGTAIYAQNKRQQVELNERWASDFGSSGVLFYSMHPGWSDTPGVSTSMESFYKSMKSRLRTPEQGADTIIWAAVSDEVLKYPNGSFLEDRRAVSTHLALAQTRSTKAEQDRLIQYIENLLTKIVGESSK